MRNWLALLAGVLVIEDLLTIAFDRPFINEFMSVAYATANPIWMLWLAVVVAAPLFEEMFFRGFLLKGLAASFLGPIGAVAATSGLWAVLHLQYDLYDIANIFCLGLLLGTARLVTGSLFVPLMLHAITNLLATVEVALLR
jgi:membrane protease YdiL (CAAX protease family)